MRVRLDRRGLVALAGLTSLGVQARSDNSFDLRVPMAPMLRSVDGVDEVVYELHLDNHALVDLKPLRVEVRDANGDCVLASYEGSALEQRLDRSGVQWKAQTCDAIPSGRRGVMFYSDVSQMGVGPWTPAPSEMNMRSAMPSSLSVVQWIRSGTADRGPRAWTMKRHKAIA
jgi:hypothetical protein